VNLQIVEFMIQILKRTAKLASEAKARRRRLGAERSDANWPSARSPGTPGVREALPHAVHIVPY
jgi:hypothetical protein